MALKSAYTKPYSFGPKDSKGADKGDRPKEANAAQAQTDVAEKTLQQFKGK